MTPLQWTLAGFGLLILMGAGGLLGYAVIAMQAGWRTPSGYLKTAPRWVVAAVAFTAGLVVGILGAHWWFPTVGD